MLAHGFASPRHRGFALIGNQCCTDSAATVAHDENASKSEYADFYVQASVVNHEVPTVTIMRVIPAFPTGVLYVCTLDNCYRNGNFLEPIRLDS